jgi:tetratricopeptide (TPR) repeat protein
MKRILYILFLITLLGCEDNAYDEVTKYAVIDNEQDKIDLINGIYSRLVRVHDRSYFSLMSRADDVNMYSNYSFMTGQSGCGSSGSSDFTNEIGDVYVNLYAAIVNANELISSMSVSDDAEILGETYFLRAYCYFKLARFFGTPPLVIDTDVNYLLEKPSFDEVYALIEEDLLNAIDLLPETCTAARVPFESPHKGTAKALLAEVYLTMAGYPLNIQGKYAEAARLAGEVIENARYYGFELVPDLKDLATKSDQHCSEHIFSLFMKDDGTNPSTSLGGFSGLYFDETTKVFRISSTYKMEFKFFKNYPVNYRRNVFIKCGEYTYANHSTIDTTYSVLEYALEDPLINPCNYISNVGYLKWVDMNDLVEINYMYQNTVRSSYISIYLLRYAQTLLTYAEAKARSGQLDESAYEAVNMIRRRANKIDIHSPSEFDLPQGLTNEQFIDSVVWERAWELCFEPDGRWFDIIRLNLKEKLNSEYRYSFDAPTVMPQSLLTDDWYFYKIPQEDRWMNPNFE